MKKLSASVLAVVLLAGCASQIMQGYIGKPLVEPIMDYGAPIGAMDMPDGSRVFQWNIHSQQYIPQTTYYSGSSYGMANAVGNSIYGSATSTGTSTTYGGYVASSNCTYNLFARKTGGGDTPADWTVTGFRKPSLSCE